MIAAWAHVYIGKILVCGICSYIQKQKNLCCLSLHVSPHSSSLRVSLSSLPLCALVASPSLTPSPCHHGTSFNTRTHSPFSFPCSLKLRDFSLVANGPSPQPPPGSGPALRQQFLPRPEPTQPGLSGSRSFESFAA